LSSVGSVDDAQCGRGRSVLSHMVGVVWCVLGSGHLPASAFLNTPPPSIARAYTLRILLDSELRDLLDLVFTL
jgi:hypothetical protein